MSGSNLYLYCYFGGRSTLDTISYGDLLYESKWFRLPTKLEKYFTFMIANAQRPLHYHGFQIARLNLNTFLGVTFFSSIFYLVNFFCDFNLFHF